MCLRTIQLIILLNTVIFSCTGQQMEWVQSISGDTWVAGEDVATDSYGNIYHIGWFVGTADFDPGIGQEYLTSINEQDVYILKLNPQGELIWVKQFVGDGISNARSLVIDPHDNLILTGFFSGSIDFDPGPNQFVQNSAGSNDTFVIKLDSAGTLIWAKVYGGQSTDTSEDLAVDQWGNIYITGRFFDSIDVDPGPGTAVITAQLPEGFSYVLSFDEHGIFRWVKQFNILIPFSITSNESSIVFVGSFLDQCDLDPGPNEFIVTETVPNSGGVIVKLDLDGNFLFGKQIGKQGSVHPYEVEFGNHGEIYVVGDFSGTVDFDDGPQTDYHTANVDDAFIWKMNSAGDHEWTKTLTGTWSDRLLSVEIGCSSIYVSGHFHNDIDVDPDSGLVELVADSLHNAFILRLNLNGELEWWTHLSGQNASEYADLLLDNDRLFAFGDFRGSMNIVSTIDSIPITSIGQNGVYGISFLEPYEAEPFDISLSDTSCFVYISPTGNIYTQSGIYQDTLCGTICCDTVYTLDLQIDGFHTSMSYSDGLLYSFEENAYYQWLDCENGFSEILGAQSQIFLPPTNGSYAVELTSNGCVDTTNCVSIIDVGVDYLEDELEVSIHPNPTNRLVHLSWNIEGRLQLVRLFDQTGRLVDDYSVSVKNYLTIKMPGGSGIYSLQLIDSDGKSDIRKIMKN